MEPLRPMKLFTISMDEAQNGKAIINCYCSIAPLKHDDCDLTLSDAKRTLTMQCSSQEEPQGPAFSTYFRQKVLEWILEHADETKTAAFLRAVPHFIEKFNVLAQCAANKLALSYVKIDFPRVRFNFAVPIQPGLFKGTYSNRGIQLVRLIYGADEHDVRGIKITVLYRPITNGHLISFLIFTIFFPGRSELPRWLLHLSCGPQLFHCFKRSVPIQL